MIDPKFFDDLAKKFTQVMPASVRDMQKEMEKNFKAVLQTGFAKLDLVTREEFDVQRHVLQRTRIKLEAMEKQLAALEKQLGVGTKKTSKKAASASVKKKTTDEKK